MVDHPGGATALLLKLCWQSDVRIGYLHGLAMARAWILLGRDSEVDPTLSFRPKETTPITRSRYSGWSRVTLLVERLTAS